MPNEWPIIFMSNFICFYRQKELLILGERAKWIPMSAQRFTQIRDTGEDIRVDLSGKPSETVEFHFILDKQPIKVVCKFPQSGLAFISIDQRQCFNR